MKFIFLVLLSGICFQNMIAQPLLSLDDAIQMGLTNSLALRQTANGVLAATINNDKGNAGMLPRVTASLSDNLSNTNLFQQRFANGTEINRNFVFANALLANVQANWNVYDGHRMQLTKQRLEALVQLNTLESTRQSNDLKAQISTAYYQVLRQEQQLQVIDTLSALIKEQIRLAELRLQVGVAPKTELLQAKLDWQEQQGNRLRQLNAIKQAKTNLNALLERPLETDFRVNEGTQDLAELNENNITLQIQQNNSSLQVAKQQANIAMLAPKEARALRLPTLGVLGNYAYQLNNNQAGFSLYAQNLGLTVGFIASMPLYDGGQAKRAAQLADISVQNAQLAVQELDSQLAQQRSIAVQNYKTALALAALERENVGLARDLISVSMERYRLGQTPNILELKEAQRQLELISNRLIQARFDARMALIVLEALQD